ncbi:hypothetical protein [Rugamonas sp.]|uniref:hypothetical protein n=1 Tax=Rugamonas sp. TaxID=1926287 RepID=UPI0025FE1DB6|nr:hypothetical protein [Rugamonas sp.]
MTPEPHEIGGAIEPVPGIPGLSLRGASRRRFTRAGVAASGVLLTLHSQPGMACDICNTPSGYLSGGLQSFRGAKPVCTGRSPSYWQGAAWPGGCNKTSMFSTVFTCTGSNKTTYGKCSLQSMLTLQSFDKYGVGNALVACWLNVHSSKSTFQTETMLKNIWNEYQSKGYYSPTAGVSWTGTQIVAYLKGTYY